MNGRDKMQSGTNSSENANESDGRTIRRRQLIGSVGAAGLAGIAGCAGLFGGGGGSQNLANSDACSVPTANEVTNLLPQPQSVSFLRSRGPLVGEFAVGTDANAVARYTERDGGTYDMMVARYEDASTAQSHTGDVRSAGETSPNEEAWTIEVVVIGNYIFRVDGTVAEELPDFMAMSPGVSDACAEEALRGTVDRSLGNPEDYPGDQSSSTQSTTSEETETTTETTTEETTTQQPAGPESFSDDWEDGDLANPLWRRDQPTIATAGTNPTAEVRSIEGQRYVGSSPNDESNAVFLRTAGGDWISINTDRTFNWAGQWRLSGTIHPYITADNPDEITDYSGFGRSAVGYSSGGGGTSFNNGSLHLLMQYSGNQRLLLDFSLATPNSGRGGPSITHALPAGDEIPWFQFDIEHQGEGVYQFRVWPAGESPGDGELRTDDSVPDGERPIKIMNYGVSPVGSKYPTNAILVDRIAVEPL